jgi:hypothetical protein
MTSIDIKLQALSHERYIRQRELDRLKVQTASGVQWVPYHYVHPGIDASNPHFGNSGMTNKL